MVAAAYQASIMSLGMMVTPFLAVCLVRAMVAFCCNDDVKRCVFTSVRVMLVFFRFASPARVR